MLTYGQQKGYILLTKLFHHKKQNSDFNKEVLRFGFVIVKDILQ